MKQPDKIDLDIAEVDALLDRLSSNDLSEDDRTLIEKIIRCYIWVQQMLSEAKMSIRRLRTIFGFRTTEKRQHLKALAAEDESSFVEPEDQGVQAEVPSASIKGHGRLSHEAYSAATTVEQRHESLKAGDLCPEDCGGRVYSIAPQAIICLKGHGLASATRYLLERLRCALCGRVFIAAPPAGTSLQKYDPSLKAQLAIAKSYAGLPFYRVQQLQQMVGVPLPASSQWQLIETLADDIYPVYFALERLAAQGELIHQDDTKVKVLSLLKENETLPDKARRGMYTTGIVSKVGLSFIYLFISGRSHSGENLRKLLSLRPPDLAPFIRMVDASNMNLPAKFKEILCLCLAHGRRKFYEIFDYFPGQCRIVIDALATVYHHDEQAAQQKMTAKQRLIYHQTHSAPVMEALKIWLNQQMDQKLVEPNSSLGKAIHYMLKHWDGLTQFLKVPGAPLDNNLSERALKIAIRTRKNSLFYKNEHGAFIGGMLTSLIHTCMMAQQNPVDYLICLQNNRSALFKDPDQWFPWNYSQTMQAQAALKAASL